LAIRINMIDSSIKPNAFNERLSACPLCGGGNIRFLFTIEKYTPSFGVDRCGSCGFIFMNPRFNDAAVSGFYDEDYYSGGSEYSYHDERKSLKFFSPVWNKRIAIIRKYVKEGNLLDVGCAFGGFLNAAAHYFVPHGIEISPYAAAHAQSILGNTIHMGTLADHPFPHNYFSVITMIELLEHLPDPAAALRESRKLLRRGGLLVVQTANMDGLQARVFGRNYAYFMPGHLSYFTRQSLTMLLQKIGFGKIRVYYPVEFGLMPKLMKSRSDITRLWDYRKWIRIAAYHYASKIHFGNVAATSSMVVYAIK